MKESGLNYFFNNLNVFTGFWDVFYTFEEGAGNKLNSISGGQSQFSGVIQNVGNFWQSTNKGYFTGQSVSISNANQLISNSFTVIMVYEKTTNNGGILFSSLSGGSGFQIGLTDTNKPYFQTYNNGPIVATSLNNYGTKNAISFSYIPNFIVIGNYNFTSQNLESEIFNCNFNLTANNQTSNWNLAPSWTGNLEYFLYFSQYLGQNFITPLLSGLYTYPTGTGYNIQTICVSGIITGSQTYTIVNTGVTGYISTPFDLGNGYQPWYTGIFPGTGLQIPLTGIINTGISTSGITGTICYQITGAPIVLFETLTGYVQSYGMEKIQLFTYIQPNDFIKIGVSSGLFDNNYNIFGTPGYSGFLLPATYSGNQINMFLNGIGQANQGWFLSGNYLLMTGVNNSDILFIDTKFGNQNIFVINASLRSFPFIDSGQQFYLNGVNLASGSDYFNNGTGITLIGNNGITGYIFEYPIVLSPMTGNYSELTISKFDRDTSNVYLNGVRQGNGLDYIEGSAFDMFSGNYFNNNQNYLTIIYNDNNQYWSAQ